MEVAHKGCPKCGGALAFDAASNVRICAACGEVVNTDGPVSSQAPVSLPPMSLPDPPPLSRSSSAYRAQVVTSELMHARVVRPRKRSTKSRGPTPLQMMGLGIVVAAFFTSLYFALR